MSTENAAPTATPVQRIVNHAVFGVMAHNAGVAMTITGTLTELDRDRKTGLVNSDQYPDRRMPLVFPEKLMPEVLLIFGIPDQRFVGDFRIGGDFLVEEISETTSAPA